MAKNNYRTAYVCGVDYQHEIGETCDVVLYASVEDLKAKRTCWKQCGIVELKIQINKWVEPQDLFKDLTKDKK